MAWQTPKTDWSAADGVRNTDMNRIEGNIKELYESGGGLHSDMTIYVATTGNDTTGNGTQALPYATINKALSVIPKHLDGKQATINIGAGTYTENVSAVGFQGGQLYFLGNNGAVTISGNVTIMACTYVRLYVQSFSITGYVTVDQHSTVRFDTALTMTGSTPYGLYVLNGSTVVVDATYTKSNVSVAAVYCHGSRVLLNSVVGSNNNAAFYVARGGIISFEADSIVATSKYITGGGGRIYRSGQTQVPNY